MFRNQDPVHFFKCEILQERYKTPHLQELFRQKDTEQDYPYIRNASKILWRKYQNCSSGDTGMAKNRNPISEVFSNILLTYLSWNISTNEFQCWSYTSTGFHLIQLAIFLWWRLGAPLSCPYPKSLG